MFATSRDGTQIYYEATGSGPVALVCVHGWMGHTRWWDSVRDAFSSTHEVLTLDLAGHGGSGTRANNSAQSYAEDVLAVAAMAQAPRVVLVGHSMSGAWVTIAAPQTERLAAVILVDTLKNLDAMPTQAQADQMLGMYRQDYANAVATLFPKFLFSPQTPTAVSDALLKRFMSVSGDVAADLLAPLYRIDVRESAPLVSVPVRGITGDHAPGNPEVNRRYYADYDVVALTGCGHYPMLEQPAAFNALLRATLISLGL
ncbi:MAG TPA: alpha/beta hydrolase [Kofleriaceae bacterium]|jgi:pimeloyl-ACP methyl ester carboxylesterase